MQMNQWIETHAAQQPSKVAIVDRVGQKTLTYAEFHQACQLTACKLVSCGVTQGDRVAIFANNCPEYLQLLFACAQLGAILVPLNWRLAEAELAQILKDCDPRVLFIDSTMSQPAPLHAQTVDLQDVTKVVPRELARLDLPEDTPVAIFYTGGTTGVPKGAVLTQKSIRANAHGTIKGWGLVADDVAPVFTPMFHTGGMNVLSTPLLCLGGTLVLPEPFQPELALKALQEESCTALFLVPTMYDMLRKVEGFSKESLSTVRMVISGGAPCPRSLFQAYWDAGLPLKQLYGLTEAGPNNFAVDVEDTKARPGTVGRPTFGVTMELRREDGSLAGTDEVGELFVSGDHVMQGYLNRPEATAEVLNDGWLRTGDLATRDADGFYYISGRSKEMYISGGENVFPAEVEEVLLDHPRVSEVAVVGVPHPKWGEVGRSFVVLKDTRPEGVEDISKFCRERLAGFKVPKEIHVVEELPKSAAGKVLKKQLAEMSL